MMKKAMALLGAVLLLAFSGVAFAEGYPKYYKGYKDYPLANAHMGTAQYMSRRSVKVEKNEPPIVIISANYLCVDDADRGVDVVTSWYKLRFYYDMKKREMYFENDNKWQFMPPYGCEAEKYYMPMGEMVFKQVFKKDFYK